VWVEVEDQGGRWAEDDSSDERGRGLDIVTALADYWDIEGDEKARVLRLRLAVTLRSSGVVCPEQARPASVSRCCRSLVTAVVRRGCCHLCCRQVTCCLGQALPRTGRSSVIGVADDLVTYGNPWRAWTPTSRLGPSSRCELMASSQAAGWVCALPVASSTSSLVSFCSLPSTGWGR